jgi:hypothetical protein
MRMLLSTLITAPLLAIAVAAAPLAAAPLNPAASSSEAARSDHSGLVPTAIAAAPSGAAAVSAFIQTHRSQLATSPQTRAALDALCHQRDCDASELFWYTDWDAAKAAAQASGKPILSLRLLGNLDEDLSCANSRFFRVALYPNLAVRQLLSDRYILHWQSVRPVPKVTVDFGDGRKLERTLTGNSIHYITTPSGEPIDALPGLYGPQAFLRHLKQAAQTVQAYQARPEADRPQFLEQYHRDRLTALQAQWAKDLRAVGANPPALLSLTPNPDAPTAIDAGRIAMTKAVVESPLVMATRSAANQNQTALTQITDAATWTKLAARYAQDAQLDANSQKLIQRKTNAKTTAALAATLQAFEANMALDSIRNEYLLHSQLHQWFLAGPIGGTRNLERLNTRVYDQLFLTPDRDPWLGLVSPDSFSAIDGDGIR